LRKMKSIQGYGTMGSAIPGVNEEQEYDFLTEVSLRHPDKKVFHHFVQNYEIDNPDYNGEMHKTGWVNGPEEIPYVDKVWELVVYLQ